MPSLRRIIKDATNLNIQRCAGCLECDTNAPDQDVPLGSIIQMALMDDEECLTCRTLWSEDVLAQATICCQEGLNLKSIVLVLREEAQRRGLA